MQPITFTNGNRIFTPSAQSQQFQLTDLNGDGEIDILDAALINSNPGGIVIVNPPPPTLTDDEFTPVEPFVEPQYCVDSGIILTGCSSVYRVDGTIDYPPAPDDPFFCPDGKVRGFAYVAETNSLQYISECTCPEENSAVHAVNILLVFASPGKKATTKVTKEACIRAIATAEDALQAGLRRRKFLEGMINATYDAGRSYLPHIQKLEDFIKGARAKIAAKVSERTGLPYTPRQIADFEARIEFWQMEREKMLRYIQRDKNTVERIQKEMLDFDKLLDEYRDVIKQWNEMLDALNNYDPERLLGILMTGLLPIGQFFVPKFCGGGAETDSECKCVPKSSGSYSSSYTNNINISNYNIIENL